VAWGGGGFEQLSSAQGNFCFASAQHRSITMSSVLDLLAPALVQTFATILLGYAVARLQLLSVDGVRGLGMFVSLVSLPALLLRSMATINLSQIEWTFFNAQLLGKATLFIFTAIIVLLRNRCSKRGMSDAGAFAIFVSQSNDFAMGLPILTGLFADTHPTYPQLLYVIAPISLIVLNPIGMLLMESGREYPDGAPAIAAETKSHANEIVIEPAKEEDDHIDHKLLSAGNTDSSTTATTSVQPIAVAPASPSLSSSSSSVSHAPFSGVSSELQSSAKKKKKKSGRRETAATVENGEDGSISSISMHESRPPPQASVATEKRVEQILNEKEDEDEDGDIPVEALRLSREHSIVAAQVDALLASDSDEELGLGSSASDEEDEESETFLPLSRRLNLNLPEDGMAMPMDMHMHAPRSKEMKHGDEQTGDSAHAHVTASPTGGNDSVTKSVAPAAKPSPIKTLLLILWRVARSPVVLSNIVGLIANFIFGGRLPGVIDPFLAALGSTFSGLALFVLGFNMHGKLDLFSDRKRLPLPILLILGKSLALPIVIRLFIVGAIGVPADCDLTACAFLVGTLPTAPSVPFFAAEFDAHSTPLIGPAMILGHIVAAPIMFVSAQMTNLDLTTSAINGIISSSTRIASAFGFIGATYAIICLCYNGMWKQVRSKLLITLLIMQMFYTASVQLCIVNLGGSGGDSDVAGSGSDDGTSSGVGATIRFMLVAGSNWLVYIYCALLGLNEVVRRFHGIHAEAFLYKFYHLIAALLVSLTLTLLLVFGERSAADMPFCECWNRFGRAQWWCTIAIFLTCFITLVLTQLVLRNDASYDEHAPLDTQPHHMHTQVLLPSSPGRQLSEESHHSIESIIDYGNDVVVSQTPYRALTDDGTSPPPTLSSDLPSRRHQRHISIGSVAGTEVSLPQGSKSPRPRRRDRDRDGSGSARLMSPIEQEEFWLSSMRVFLLFVTSALFLSTALYFWSADSNGIRVECQLLDAVIFGTCGIYTCALFAITPYMASPMKALNRKVRRIMRRLRKKGTNHNKHNKRTRR